MPSVWSQTLGHSSVCVAVLDGPIDGSHPCFQGANLTQLPSPVSATAGGGMAIRHGTHLTSLIFGQPDSEVRGLAPRCRGLVIPIYRERGDGSLVACSQLDLARAIALALTHGADIINVSGGRADPTGQPDPMLARVLAQCAAQRVLVVAAAGNDGCPCLHVPAAAESVLVAGAMDAEGEPLEFSNFGGAYQSHGILAPGEEIVGAAPGGGTIAYSGTSVAAAVVSGVAALLASLQLQHHGRVDAPAVRDALVRGATPCAERPAADCRRLLAGRLNVSRALSLLTPGESSAMNLPQDTPDPVANRTASPAPPPSPVPPEASRPPEPAAPRPTPPSGGCRGGASALVYALGLIDYDFGTEARRDFFFQRRVANPHDRVQLLAHLDKPDCESDVLGLTWVLAKQSTPVYALQPAGPFARETHARLRAFLRGQLGEGVTQVSIPGVQVGFTHLMNGQEIPIIVPDVRGMYSWSTPALVQAVLGTRPADPGPAADYDEQAKQIGNFLDRVYYELSNLGVTPRDRALNYAATNAYQAATVYKEAIALKLKLDRVELERSAVCRPGADCWDVKLTFFDPSRRQDRAREVYQFTVDVSEIIPVTVGQMRRWSMY